MSELIKHFGIDWKLLAAQVVNFAILLFLLKRFAYKPILGMLKKRREEIEKGLKFTKDAETKLNLIGEEREEVLKTARQEALKIVGDAEHTGRIRKDEALTKAAELLAELGLEARSRHFPNQLSGGEQQRVAIARALLTDPLLFLADEPTGNLDLETSERVFELMRECHLKRGLTSVIVTHNPELAARCDRVFEMKQR